MDHPMDPIETRWKELDDEANSSRGVDRTAKKVVAKPSLLKLIWWFLTWQRLGHKPIRDNYKQLSYWD